MRVIAKRTLREFWKKHADSEIIHLTKNYRSNKQIVDFMNKSIEEMKLPNLEHHKNEESLIKIINLENESLERNFVVNKISYLFSICFN